MKYGIILAGGKSTRLYPFEDKSLQVFCGVTLLERHIIELEKAGLDHFIIITNPDNDREMQEIVGKDKANISYVIQPEPIGIADALLRALLIMEDQDAFVYITQAHDILDPGFHISLLAYADAHPNAFVIAAKKVSAYFPGGYLIPRKESSDRENELIVPIMDIIEKPGEGNEPSDLVTLVAHAIPKASILIETLHALRDINDGGYEKAVSLLLQTYPGFAFVHPGESSSLKYPWHMLDITQTLLNQISGSFIHESATIEDGVTISGTVYIEEGVHIYKGAYIKGPVYLGKNTIVGNNALVRESIIGKDCIIGFGAEVARSYFGEKVLIHTNYVGDSVISNDVMFGYGSLTSNTRLDDKTISVTVKGERIDTHKTKLGQMIGTGSRIGVQAALMPGVIIGKHSLIGPGLVISKDVADNSKLIIKQEVTQTTT